MNKAGMGKIKTGGRGLAEYKALYSQLQYLVAAGGWLDFNP
jgi:hypothetical protein